MSTVTFRDLLTPFAASIFAKSSALRRFDAAQALSKSQRARLVESISDDIKKCTNFFTPRVSKAAHDKACELGCDLVEMHWHNQHRFDRERQTFHWEHMVPVKALREECCKANSEAEILEILTTRLCVVWVLKSEDAELTRLGFRSIRKDPMAAYREAGIELL
jgi:hypothetical protein